MFENWGKNQSGDLRKTWRGGHGIRQGWRWEKINLRQCLYHGF